MWQEWMHIRKLQMNIQCSIAVSYTQLERGQLARCSDDGEPGVTAGKPMLDVLLGEEIRNIVVVVTRYFGGTLLGTGGLVRAYSCLLYTSFLFEMED